MFHETHNYAYRTTTLSHDDVISDCIMQSVSAWKEFEIEILFVKINKTLDYNIQNFN